MATILAKQSVIDNNFVQAFGAWLTTSSWSAETGTEVAEAG